jgi:hypothetical protein
MREKAITISNVDDCHCSVHDGKVYRTIVFLFSCCSSMSMCLCLSHEGEERKKKRKNEENDPYVFMLTMYLFLSVCLCVHVCRSHIEMRNENFFRDKKRPTLWMFHSLLF